jgi:hypothetical protein
MRELWEKSNSNPELDYFETKRSDLNLTPRKQSKQQKEAKLEPTRSNCYAEESQKCDEVHNMHHILTLKNNDAFVSNIAQIKQQK